MSKIIQPHEAAVLPSVKNSEWIGRPALIAQAGNRIAASNGPFSKDVEDRLDWLENHSRPPADRRRVDRAFFVASYTATLFWALLIFGLVGSAVAVVVAWTVSK